MRVTIVATFKDDLLSNQAGTSDSLFFQAYKLHSLAFARFSRLIIIFL